MEQCHILFMGGSQSVPVVRLEEQWEKLTTFKPTTPSPYHQQSTADGAGAP